jgi:hypothetical protein
MGMSKRSQRALERDLAEACAAVRRKHKQRRIQRKAKKLQAKQDIKDERMYVRWLLFCKGRGRDKNLNQKDSLYINKHVHEAHDRYLLLLLHGIETRPGTAHKKLKSNPAYPLSFKKYRRAWYGGAKFNYIYYDVPKLMKMKWEKLHASGNTEVSQQPAGKWMLELQRAISERQPGDVGLSVSELPRGIRRDKGSYQRQKQIRERGAAEAGSNRDAATVGT